MFKQDELAPVASSQSLCAARSTIAATSMADSPAPHTSRTRRHWLALLRSLIALTLLMGAPAALAANLQISSIVDRGNGTTPVGDPVTYAVTINNTGTAGNGVASIFDLPAGTTAGAMPAYCSVPDVAVPTRVQCDHGTFGSGQSRTFDMEVLTAGLTPGPIAIAGAIGFDTALPAPTTPVMSLDEATDPFFNGDTQRGNNVHQGSSTLVDSADLELTKLATPDPVIGGGEITYTLTVTNKGPSVSAGFRVVDALPASLEYVGGLSGAGWALGAVSGNTVPVNYTGPALAVGQSSSFSFKAKANIGTGNVTNTANVEAGSTPDTVPNNNTATATSAVTSGADVRVNKNASPTPAISGQPITFTIVVTNDGPSAAANVAFADAMPAGFIITGGNQPAGWTCSTGAGDTTRSCQIPSLASGTSTTFTIETTVPAIGVNSSGDVTNTVDVTSDTLDPNAGNNTGSTTFTVLPDGADLQLDSKAKVPALVAIWKPGDDLEIGRMTSTIKLRNKGPRDAIGNVQVVDTLAPGEAFVQSDSPAWSCSAVPVSYTPGTPQVVTCDLLGITPASPLAVGAQAPDLVLVTRAMAASANLVNRACTGGSGGSVEPETGSLNLDRNEDNDCRNGDGVRTTDERTDLKITKTATTANGDKVLDQTEDTVTYTLTVTNDGPNATAGVVINDQIPGYLAGTAITPDTALAPGFSCQVAGASVICRSGDNVLASGASATIVITANRGLYDSIGRASLNCGGETIANAWCNTASIGIEAQYAGAVGEVNTGNNSDSDWVQVEPVTNVQTQSKTVTPATGQIGVDTTYSMAYRNNGPSSAVGVVFRDVFTLDAGDAGFVLRSAARTGGGTAVCAVTHGDGITTAVAAGGTSYRAIGGAGSNYTVTVTCSPVDMARNSGQSLTVVIRPNLDSGNIGRTLTNVAGFYFDIDGDGNPDPAIGIDGNGNSYNYNSVATDADDKKTASLPFGSGQVQLITRKIDYDPVNPFVGGIDPLGYDAETPDNNFITYRITVQNLGPSVANDVRIKDTISPPAGREVRYIGVAATPVGPFVENDCTVMPGSSNPVTGPGTQTLDCPMPGAGFGTNVPGVVAANSTSTLYLRYRYESAPSAGGDTMNNVAVASAAEPNSSTEDQYTGKDNTTIFTRADLGVAKNMIMAQPAADPGVDLLPGDKVTSVALRQPFFYVIDSINNGPGASLSKSRVGNSPLNGTGTVITDTLPAGLVVRGGAAAITWQKIGDMPPGGGDEHPNGTGTCTQTGNVVTCNVGDVTAKGKVRVIVPAVWNTYPAGGTSNNTAEVKTEQVDPNPGNDKVTVPLDVTRSSIAGVVFEDRDRAGANGGTQQAAATEPGIGAVTVTLSGTDAYGNAVSRNADTAADGSYSFDNLSPSDADGYKLVQTQPAGYINGPVPTPTSGGSEPSLGGTYAIGAPDSTYTAINVGVAEVGVRYNFPEVRMPSLSGYVYIDSDFSDKRNAGDLPIVGTTVELLDAAGTVLETTTTNASGFYEFTGLDPLITYDLREVLPTGNYRNRPTAINPGLINGVACASGCTPGTGIAPDAATTDRISAIDLGAGLHGTEFNFGEDAISAISGTVYLDRNGNGSFDGGDAGDVNSQPNGGLSGVTVTLTGAGPDGVFGSGDDPVSVVVQTYADGGYRFEDLVVGQNYKVTESQPNGYANGTENPSNAVDVPKLDAAGKTGINFGEVLGSISGSVFEDFSGTAANNNNGLFDAGENPIGNVTLTLGGVDVNGAPVSMSVQTVADGSYSFSDLLPPQAGTSYTITQTQPTGYIDGKHTPGSASTPGDASVSNVISGIVIGIGEDASGYLFGELANAIISGTVYLDGNDDGTQGAGEPGIPGVTVVIEGAGPDGVFGTADDLPPVSVTTDANGDYSYGGAIAGQNYRITETQPNGLADGKENTGNVIPVSNLPAAGSSGNNFGELAGSLSGNVYLDANNNGVRDSGENGIPGVSVSLPAGTLDTLGNAVAAMVTDANGDYRFDDLLAGTYTVTQQIAQPVVGGVTTINGTTTAGTIDGVSSGTATAVASVPSAVAGITLPAGKHSVRNDFGETLPVSLAGTVYHDLNNNGAQDNASEAGINDVEIVLAGADDTGAAVSLTTRTDANGHFSFDGLRPGTYTATEPTQPTGTSNGQTTAGQVNGASSGTATPITTVPSVIAGVDLTTPGHASVDNLFGEIPLNSSISGRVWLDTDNDGVIDADETGIAGVTIRLQGTDLAGNVITRDTTTLADGSYAFTELPPGIYTITEPDQPDGTLNGTTVAGPAGGTVTLPTTAPSVIADITLAVNQNAAGNDFGEIPAGSISGRVYSDNNNDGQVDTGEAGIGGVEVVLTGTNELGETVSVTVTTDSEGRYRFDGLRPGTYAVTEPTQPSHTLNGITSAGTIDGATVGTATDVATVPSAITAIVLPPGGTSIDNNFGEIGDSPDLMVSKSATPATFTVNNIGTYVITVRNGGQQPSRGEYVVEDRLPAGVTLAETPAGAGWVCAGAIGDDRFRCTSSVVIAAGATLADAIHARVRVAASAATGTPVNNAVLVEGGGENEFRTPTPQERADFDGNPGDLPVCDAAITQNACRLPTQVQLSASLSGTVWFEQGSDMGLLDSGDRRLPGWTVEIVDANGQVIATSTTATDGSYSVADLVPGIELSVRFRDPSSGVLWGYPISGETVAGSPVPCDATSAMANGTASSCAVTDGGISHLSVVLTPGQNLPQQSLPLNPGGVVYDAVTRNPVPGSVVTLTPVGACPGYSPENHILHAGAGGYRVDGNAVSMTVGSEGFYQFLLANSAPASCRFQLSVTPPAGYTFESGMIPSEGAPLSPSGKAGTAHPVQDNATAPTVPVGSGTTYHLELQIGSGMADVVRNHIPLDPQVAPGLVITKTGDRKTVEVGDSMVYTIAIRQTAGAALGTVNVIDRLPPGFTYIAGTARMDGSGIADPLGKPGPTLVFDVGSLVVGGQKTLSYRVRIGVGSQQGDGINRARAHGCSITGGCVDPDTLQPYPGGGVIASNPAEYRVRVSGGVFSDEGCVLGKIFVDCNLNHVQDHEELGIPGVRMYFEDGTWLVSDSEGKYSYCGLPPKSHTLKVDSSTLPTGSRLTTSSNRNLGDADSLFIDLKNGELHRADFIEGSCSNAVIEQVKARRTQGEIRAPETEAGQKPLRFDSKPLRAPRQGTDSADQLPIVAPRPTDAGRTDGQPEVQP